MKCDFCNYLSKNKTMLITHILNNHKTKKEKQEEFKYYCTKCDFGTFAINSFNIHKNTKKHIHNMSIEQTISEIN